MKFSYLWILYIGGLLLHSSCMQSSLLVDESDIKNQSINLNNDVQLNVEGAVILSHEKVQASNTIPSHFVVQLKAQSLDFKIDVIHQGCSTQHLKLIINQSFNHIKGSWQVFTQQPSAIAKQLVNQTSGLEWEDGSTLQAISQVYPLTVQNVSNQISWWIQANQVKEYTKIAPDISLLDSKQFNQSEDVLCTSVHQFQDIYNREKGSHIIRSRIILNNDQPNIRFAVTHSIFNNTEQLEDFITIINQSNVEFIIVLGNTKNPASDQQVTRLVEVLNRLKMPYFFVSGSEEISQNSAYWSQILGANNFAFDHKQIRFTFLDASLKTFKQAQYDLLKRWSQTKELIWTQDTEIQSRFLFMRYSPLNHIESAITNSSFIHHLEGVRLINLLGRYGFTSIFSAGEQLININEANSMVHTIIPSLARLQESQTSTQSIQWIKVDINEECIGQMINQCMTIELY